MKTFVTNHESERRKALDSLTIIEAKWRTMDPASLEWAEYQEDVLIARHELELLETDQ